MNVNEIKTYYQDNGKWKECEFLSGEEMAQRATELLRENVELKNTIDKAIKEIEKYIELCVTEPDMNYLLDILKGSDSNGKI